MVKIPKYNNVLILNLLIGKPKWLPNVNNFGDYLQVKGICQLPELFMTGS